MSAGYYRKTKKNFKNKFAKGIKIFLKKKKIKNENIIVSIIGISLKMKTKAN